MTLEIIHITIAINDNWSSTARNTENNINNKDKTYDKYVRSQ